MLIRMVLGTYPSTTDISKFLGALYIDILRMWDSFPQSLYSNRPTTKKKQMEMIKKHHLIIIKKAFNWNATS